MVSVTFWKSPLADCAAETKPFKQLWALKAAGASRKEELLDGQHLQVPQKSWQWAGR